MIHIFIGKDDYKRAIKFAKSRFSVIRKYGDIDLSEEYNSLDNKVYVFDNIDTITRLVFYSEVIKEDNNVELHINNEVLTDYILKYLVEVIGK